MKKILTLIVMASVILALSSCDKEEKDTKVIVTLGAQSNTKTGAFYSVGLNKVFNQANAFTNQIEIDIFCFWEEGNNITLASPGSNIRGVFTGDNAPANWELKNLTMFLITELTAAQFDNLKDTDDLMWALYDPDNARKKAAGMEPGKVVAFKTVTNIVGLIKIMEVEQGAAGHVKFEIKLAHPNSR